MDNSFLNIDESPHDAGLFGPAVADGPDNFSHLLIIGDVPGNEVKELGAKTFATDQSAGKLAPINPLYAGTHGANYMHGGALHNDVNYRNAERRIQHELRAYNTNFLLDKRQSSRTPMPTSPYLPIDHPGLQAREQPVVQVQPQDDCIIL